MNKSPIEIAVGQTNILIEDKVCKAVGKVGIHINKKELLKALKAYEFVEELTNYIFTYPDDDYMTMECLCRKLVKYGLLDKVDGYYQTHDIHTDTHGCVKDTHDKTEPRKEQNFCGKCRYLYRDFKYGLSCYRLMDNEPCKYEERKDEPQTERSGK